MRCTPENKPYLDNHWLSLAISNRNPLDTAATYVVAEEMLRGSAERTHPFQPSKTSPTSDIAGFEDCPDKGAMSPYATSPADDSAAARAL